MNEVIDILLVDDEQRNLDALEVILEDPGYRLLRADDADHALRALLEHQVAAIVLDIKMPGVSGLELARLIKGTKKFREIPILFLTAYMVDDQDVLQGYGVGGVDYLTKPIKAQVLRHKISVFADLFRKTRALAELNQTLEERVVERTADLARSEAALRVADAQKDAFLATLAHELRNPLAPLRTGIDLLLQVADQTPVAARTLTAMNRQIQHMVRLIDDLLEISRINTGMLELQLESVELGSVVDRAVELVAPVAEQRAQTIAIRVPEPIALMADPIRLTQIIGNLLHNASKYTPVGGAIELAIVARPDQVHVQVIDHGLGIPTDQLGAVFEMFARIKRSAANSNNGLGIGLALSRRLATMHGGSLSVASEGEGKGTTFTLSLPRIRSTQRSTESMESATPSRSLSIVVVEDSEDGADLLVMWLERAGHRVRLARTGSDGVSLVSEIRPEVVLCDIGLPDFDGIEVCRRIQALCPGERPVMVALTGWGMDQDRRRTSEAGFDHHVVKPVALEKLKVILAGVG